MILRAKVRLTNNLRIALVRMNVPIARTVEADLQHLFAVSYITVDELDSSEKIVNTFSVVFKKDLHFGSIYGQFVFIRRVSVVFW